MRWWYLWFIILILSSCSNEQTYLQVRNNAKHKIGETFIINEGFYKGCKFTVEKIFVYSKDTFFGNPYYIEYVGKSPCNDSDKYKLGVKE